mgnify:CR=1 FL=1
MKTYGKILDIYKKGLMVLLEDGRKALLPLEDISRYKYSCTMLNRFVEVETTDREINKVIVLENKFKLINADKVLKGA